MIRLIVLLLTACSALHLTAAEVTPLMSRALPFLQGQEGMMLTVEYLPGEQSAPHRHDAHTFVYVLEGSVVMQVTGQPEVLLQTGGTFYESPADVHQVSRNASDTEPAKFVVFFIKPQGSPATVPVSAAE